jgi:hypothetical protein
MQDTSSCSPVIKVASSRRMGNIKVIAVIFLPEK